MSWFKKNEEVEKNERRLNESKILDITLVVGSAILQRIVGP